MKYSSYKIASLTFAFTFLLLLPSTRNLAQDFQRDYGTSLDNSFSKVIQDGTNYYVLGQDEAVNGAPQRATVTRLDANGLHQWTLSLNIPSVWNDAVLTPSGDLLVVGLTLPADATAKSLIGRVTQAGAFALLRSYDVTGRDFFYRIVKHPTPQNPAFPYYVLGAQFEPGGTPTTEDVTLLNLDANGVLNWKKLYISGGDDEFFRDFEVVGGNLMMAGNSTSGLIFMANNAGTMIGGVQIPQRVYRDVAPESAGGMYAAATDFGNSEAYLQKFDASLILQWEVRLPQLNNISQVWEGLPGEVYVTGMGTFGGLLRTVVIKLTDFGSPSVVWVKYLTAGTGFIGGSSWYLPPFGLAYTDARTIPGGFGQSCAFISVSDSELNTCEVSTSNTDLLFTDPLPDGPILPFAEPFPLPTGVNLQESSALNWQQQEVCSTAPCDVSITLTQVNNCGLVVACANATGPGPFTYQWCGGQTTQCVTTQLTCGTHDFCVSVTCADGTQAVAAQSIVIADQVPPVALCLGIGVILDANCTAIITPASIDGGSSDNCQIQSLSVSPAVLTGCGDFPVTLTVTDWCGNVGTCSTTVQTIESTPPVIVCPPNVQKDCNTNLTPNFTGFATATDNCDPNPVITSSDVTSGVMPCDGLIQRTWTAHDNCGNSSTCVQNILVFDNVPPVLSNCPPNVTVTGMFNAAGLCTADVQVASPTATDNCDLSVTLTNSFNNTANASGNYPQGTTTVTWTATDDCGNSATCSFTVTVDCGSAPEHCGQAVVTCFSGFNSPANYLSGVNQNAPVMALVDVRDHSTATPGTLWVQASSTEFSDPTWTPQNLGQVFGIAIDGNEDIFVAASSIYTCATTSPYTYNPYTASGPGAIYKIDGSTFAISNYTTTGAFSPGGTTIPNNGSALGDIGYDATNDQFFVTNHADGMIYRIKNGLVMSRFDPFGTLNPPSSGNFSDPSFVALTERTWGVAYFGGRVYFATWREDIGRQSATAANEVWSIGLDGAGEFQGTFFNGGGQKWEDGEVLEITLPCFPVNANFSNPVSDIAFSKTGLMLLAERTMGSDCGGAFSTNWFSYAHSSRVLEYEFNGTAWSLTPGHTTPLCSTNTNLKFTTGAANAVTDNSAGGIDYGYDSFDPATTTQPDCDRFVWNTGDNLHPPTGFNTFCSQPGTTWVYGMQGTAATGGTNYTSLLVDFDNNVCSHDKILLGDVEIFRCGCIEPDPDFPCDSLWVTKEPLIFDPGTMPDTCCWDVDFHIHAGPVAFLEVESLTPGVIFNNPALSSSFQWGGTPTGTLLPISYALPGHGIPNGDYNSALTFCLGNILTPAQDTQCVVFRWYVFGPTDIPYLACTDTCYFYCPPPIFGDTCVVVKNDSVACNPDAPLEYCYYFQVQNLSDFTASQVVLSNPTPGFAFKPCPPPNINITSPTIALPNPALNPGIAPDSCSPTLCVKIVATAPVLSPTTFCFEAGLSSNDSCCHSARKHCITLLPCCDPCEDRGVAVHTVPPQDSCCHSLDITNDCDLQFFTKLELELLTPGVIFGSHYTGGPMPGDWFNPISTNTLIQWQHISGFVPNGTTLGLINFCLDGINMPSEVPQVVVLNWITIGSDGKDSIACSDTLIFDCPAVDNKCVEVLEQHIECVEDANGNVYYQLTMTIQNVSSPPHTANEVIFTQLGGPAVTVFPNPVLISPLPFGGITTITTNIFGSGLNVGDKLTFEIRLHDSFSGDNWCCFEGDSVCVFIPPCGDCVCHTDGMTLTQNGVAYPLPCTQGAATPVLGCPAGDVNISGFFGCQSLTGVPCPETTVNWVLIDPSGSSTSGTTTNFPSLTFPAAQVDDPGTYCLTLTTLCPGAVDSCICKMRWIQPPCEDSCCTDFDAFCALVGQGFTVAITDSCKVIVTAPQFDSCHWFSTPPYVLGTNVIQVITDPSGMWMFMFDQNGTYQICVTVFEENGDSICWQKLMCTTVVVDCLDSCCTDYDAFCQAVQNATTITIGPAPCKVTLNIGDLPCDDYIESVNWGDGQTDFGPFPSGSMPMHTFAGSGTYILTYLAIELNDNGLICFEKVLHDTVTVQCPPACECGDWALALTTAGASYLLSCNNQPPLMLGCPVTDINISGSFHCVGPVPGCEPSPVSWTLFTPTGTQSGTTSAGAININFPAASVSTPGNYQLVLQSLCPGNPDSCVCTINWVQPDCPSCVCATPDLTLTAGGVAFPVGCNLPPPVWPVLGCPATDVTVSGFFGCLSTVPGTNCPDSPISWVLTGPGGVISSGGGSTPLISLTFLAAQVSAPGAYSLILQTVCPGQLEPCVCEVNWVQPDCPSCACGSFEQIKIKNKKTGLNQTLTCNNQPPQFIPCPPSGKPHVITGKLVCNGNCTASSMTWTVMNPNGTTVLSGSAPGPWFSIAIPSTAVTVNGLYMVKIQGICDGDTCECKLNLLFDGCGPNCTCNDLEMQVSQGIYLTGVGGCIKNIHSTATLTECDSVFWDISNTTGILLTGGLSLGDAPFQFNFPGSGDYKVCMKVKRTLPDGTMCMFRRCWMVKVNCGIPDLVCEAPILDNPGFAEGAQPGVLGLGGSSTAWGSNAGTPEVLTNEECVDPVALRIKGNCIILDVIDHDPIPVVIGTAYSYRLCFNQTGTSSPQPGGTLVGRLSLTPQGTGICVGECEEVFRIPVDGAPGGWVEAAGGFTPQLVSGNAFLTVHLENDFTEDDPETQSALLIDNICIEVPPADATDNPLQGQGIRLFPNPTTGDLTLEFTGATPKAGAVQIIDLYGRLLHSETLPPGGQTHPLSIASLSAGMYFVRVMDDGVPVWMRRVVKQ
ncbi:MAG: T9SS type A sorting domain-containing protein [Bacteroidetes bacterium]|nr:T9SS type A sorting domain-containing protein [Bacteroidota bacterium]